MTSWCPARTSSASDFAAIRTLARWVSAVNGSPRFNRALPPRAATISIGCILYQQSAPESGAEGGHQHGFDGVQAVLCLIKNNGCRALENLVRHFHSLNAEFGMNFFAYGCFGIMKRRQAVHESGTGIAGFLHDRCVHLIRQQQLYPFTPLLGRLTHRHPDISVDKIDPFNVGIHVIRYGNSGAGLPCNCLSFIPGSLAWPAGFWCAQADIHAHFCPTE